MEKIPAPWRLSGKGYIMIFRFSREFVRQNSFLGENWMLWFKGGFGSVMLVDYQQSEAGPYKELLFIPGRFSLWGQKHYTISKIYVSTVASVQNGRANWAIPKELAEFNWQGGGSDERVTINVHGEKVMEISLHAKGPKIPINTRVFPLSIGQEDEERVFITRPHGRGWGQLANVNALSVNHTYFPDISGIKPLMVLRVDPFQMVFPVAQQIKGA